MPEFGQSIAGDHQTGTQATFVGHLHRPLDDLHDPRVVNHVLGVPDVKLYEVEGSAAQLTNPPVQPFRLVQILVPADHTHFLPVHLTPLFCFAAEFVA